jgi:hypothetical protein
MWQTFSTSWWYLWYKVFTILFFEGCELEVKLKEKSSDERSMPIGGQLFDPNDTPFFLRFWIGHQTQGKTSKLTFC